MRRERGGQGLAHQLGETWHLMECAVARGQSVKELNVPPLLGVDEKAADKGHKNVTVVSDISRGTVEYIADERKQTSLDGYFDLFSNLAVGRDRGRGHGHEGALSHLGARPSLGRRRQDRLRPLSHVMAYLNKPVDTVRKSENRALMAAGDKSLVRTKYMWLHAAENLPERHQDRFNTLRWGDLKTSRAWAIKESQRWFWDYRRRGWGEKHFNGWYFWATHSRLQPIIDPAKTLKRHESGLLAYFPHRITSATAPGLNSRIQAIRVSARGHRNREHFKTAIFFHLGGLELYPQTH
jgi:transposase